MKPSNPTKKELEELSDFVKSITEDVFEISKMQIEFEGKMFTEIGIICSVDPRKRNRRSFAKQVKDELRRLRQIKYIVEQEDFTFPCVFGLAICERERARWQKLLQDDIFLFLECVDNKIEVCIMGKVYQVIDEDTLQALLLHCVKSDLFPISDTILMTIYRDSFYPKEEAMENQIEARRKHLDLKYKVVKYFRKPLEEKKQEVSQQQRIAVEQNRRQMKN